MSDHWFAAAATFEVEVAFAGRAFAAYAGLQVIASLMWLFLSERVRPSAFDLLGSGFCLAGTIAIVPGAKAAA